MYWCEYVLGESCFDVVIVGNLPPMTSQRRTLTGHTQQLQRQRRSSQCGSRRGCHVWGNNTPGCKSWVEKLSPSWRKQNILTCEGGAVFRLKCEQGTQWRTNGRGNSLRLFTHRGPFQMPGGAQWNSRPRTEPWFSRLEDWNPSVNLITFKL